MPLGNERGIACVYPARVHGADARRSAAAGHGLIGPASVEVRLIDEEIAGSDPLVLHVPQEGNFDRPPMVWRE
jgi:hypothetical protein